MVTYTAQENKDTATFHPSLLKIPESDLAQTIAEHYKYIVDRTRGTSEGYSCAFGYDQSTLSTAVDIDMDYIEALNYTETNQKNLEAIQFLEEWFSEPDDLGEKFWKEFRKELEENPFHIS